MRRLSSGFAVVSLLSLLLAACGTGASVTSSTGPGIGAEDGLGTGSGTAFGDLPLSFIENRGQADPDVDY